MTFERHRSCHRRLVGAARNGVFTKVRSCVRPAAQNTEVPAVQKEQLSGPTLTDLS